MRAVITAKDIGAVPRIPLRLLPLPGTERFLQPVIAADRVRYVGEPLAVVLGDSPALAEDGVGAIALDIDELPPVPDRHASGRGEILLFEEAGTNAAMVFTGVKGDADEAFRDADYVRRDRFAVQRYTALPMEPRGVLAEWDAAQGRMTVLGAAKVPFFNRDTLAAMLGLSPAQVDLIENDVGGGFGARGEFYPEDFLIPFAARHVGRSVRWLEDRREHLTAMNHARQADCEVEIACRSDGTILGLRGEVFVDLGAYVRTNGLIQPRTLAQCLTGPYRVPNVRMTSTALLTNKTPSGTYRAPGRYEGSFFCERLIELAARDLGIDSAEMRRRNLIGAGEMPYRLPRLEPRRSGRRYRVRQRRLSRDPRTLPRRVRLGGKACAARPRDRRALPRPRRRLLYRGWRSRSEGDGAARPRGGRHGVGLCRLDCGRAGPRNGDGADRRGHARYAARAGARVARLDALSRRGLRRVRVTLDRARRVGGVRGGECPARQDPHRRRRAAGLRRRTGRTGGWMRPRSRRALARLRRVGGGRPAGHDGIRQRQPADLHLRIGRGACRGRPGDGRCRIARLSRRRGCRPHRQPVDTARPGDRRHGPGLGGAFLEHLVYDANGQLLAGNLADYLIPTATDFPKIRAIALENHRSPSNPLGVKGAGEGAIIPIGGLMANAVANALASFGAMPNQLPLSPARVWHMGSAKQSTGSLE